MALCFNTEKVCFVYVFGFFALLVFFLVLCLLFFFYFVLLLFFCFVLKTNYKYKNLPGTSGNMRNNLSLISYF